MRMKQYGMIMMCCMMVALSMACSQLSLNQDPTPAVISEGRAVSYEIQTATATSVLTPQPTAPTLNDDTVLTLGSAPTFTPVPAELEPTATNTPVIVTETPTITSTTTVTETEVISETAEMTEVVTDTEVAETDASVVAPFDGELDPPLEGGEWDFEGNYVLWDNPYGDCSGALLAPGWSAFVEDGPYGSSCMGENLHGADVHSGAKSQEITFDFIAANSGIYRTIETKPGHRYQIVVHAKHVRSVAPVQMFLGIDQTGGKEWTAESVAWFPWDDATEDIWKATEETITATGDQLTMFVRGFHPSGDQGGKTYIDNIKVTHLGP